MRCAPSKVLKLKFLPSTFTHDIILDICSKVGVTVCTIMTLKKFPDTSSVELLSIDEATTLLSYFRDNPVFNPASGRTARIDYSDRPSIQVTELDQSHRSSAFFFTSRNTMFVKQYEHAHRTQPYEHKSSYPHDPRSDYPPARGEYGAPPHEPPYTHTPQQNAPFHHPSRGPPPAVPTYGPAFGAVAAPPQGYSPPSHVAAPLGPGDFTASPTPSAVLLVSVSQVLHEVTFDALRDVLLRVREPVCAIRDPSPAPGTAAVLVQMPSVADADAAISAVSHNYMYADANFITLQYAARPDISTAVRPGDPHSHSYSPSPSPAPPRQGYHPHAHAHAPGPAPGYGAPAPAPVRDGYGPPAAPYGEQPYGEPWRDHGFPAHGYPDQGYGGRGPDRHQNPPSAAYGPGYGADEPAQYAPRARDRDYRGDDRDQPLGWRHRFSDPTQRHVGEAVGNPAFLDVLNAPTCLAASPEFFFYVFGAFGDVAKVKRGRNRHVMVQFCTAEHADRTLQMLQGQPFFGQPLALIFHKRAEDLLVRRGGDPAIERDYLADGPHPHHRFAGQRPVSASPPNRVLFLSGFPRDWVPRDVQTLIATALRQSSRVPAHVLMDAFQQARQSGQEGSSGPPVCMRGSFAVHIEAVAVVAAGDGFIAALPVVDMCYSLLHKLAYINLSGVPLAVSFSRKTPESIVDGARKREARGGHPREGARGYRERGHEENNYRDHQSQEQHPYNSHEQQYTNNEQPQKQEQQQQWDQHSNGQYDEHVKAESDLKSTEEQDYPVSAGGTQDDLQQVDTAQESRE